MNPQFPEQEHLNCPRCDSSNTKFCYYNNYNLLQPRHFCKNCRRYWTKGGTLRNIPVGGATRKTNKRSNKRPATSSSSSSPTPRPTEALSFDMNQTQTQVDGGSLVDGSQEDRSPIFRNRVLCVNSESESNGGGNGNGYGYGYGWPNLSIFTPGSSLR